MKVKELIEILMDMPQDADVIFDDGRLDGLGLTEIGSAWKDSDGNVRLEN